MNMQLVRVFVIATLGCQVAFADALKVPPDISAGTRHVLALKDNGEVWAWGDNSQGQLGVPNSPGSAAPIKVTLPPGRRGIQVAGGGSHSLVLLDDHTVLSFGNNATGQLGRAGEQGTHAPSLVPGLNDVIAVSAGESHSLILKRNNTVWAFGTNESGELGDGTTIQKIEPVQARELADIIAVAAGEDTSYALKRDGTVFAWGSGYYGALGNNKHVTEPQTSPIQISNLSGITAIGAGNKYAVALKNNGTVWSWGLNDKGQVGGVGRSREEVQQVVGITDATKIAVGGNHTAVLRSDGSLWTFGNNTKGQLGLKIREKSQWNPIAQASLVKGDILKITAGEDSTFILKKDGSIIAFGSKKYGQLGDGSSSDSIPVQVYDETRARKVACGKSNSVLCRTDGTVGWVGLLELGLGGTSKKRFSQFEFLPNLGNMAQVACGSNHIVALRNDGTVWAYGDDSWGQLGNYIYSFSDIPVQIPGVTDVTAIAVHGTNSLALRRDGTVIAWGKDYKPLDRSNRDAYMVMGIGETLVASIALGHHYAISCYTNGTVATWSNYAGSIGRRPVPITGLTDIKSVAAGDDFFLALHVDCTVSVWGKDRNGALGLGAVTEQRTPTKIPNLSDVEQIATSSSHVIARLKNGTLKAWGKNDAGQLGDGTFTDRFSPVDVKKLTNVTDIAVGLQHSMAVRSDATAWSWGSNESDQLGLNTIQQHQVAIRLITDSTDTDADGMPDELERTYFGDLSHSGAQDSDEDGWSNVLETFHGTNPSLADTDQDGLTDPADPSTKPSSGNRDSNKTVGLVRVAVPTTDGVPLRFRRPSSLLNSPMHNNGDGRSVVRLGDRGWRVTSGYSGRSLDSYNREISESVTLASTAVAATNDASRQGSNSSHTVTSTGNRNADPIPTDARSLRFRTPSLLTFSAHNVLTAIEEGTDTSATNSRSNGSNNGRLAVTVTFPVNDTVL